MIPQGPLKIHSTAVSPEREEDAGGRIPILLNVRAVNSQAARRIGRTVLPTAGSVAPNRKTGTYITNACGGLGWTRDSHSH